MLSRSILLALVACSAKQPRESTRADAAAVEVHDAGADAGDASALAPLGGSWLEELEVDGVSVGYVTAPIGSTEARPVVVAVHGIYDHPGHTCAAWRAIVDGYAFVVCPAGSRHSKYEFVWPSSEAIETAVSASLTAARARYGDRMTRGPAIYAAFSQGANMAAPVLGARNGRFARAVLVEGGYVAFADARLANAFVSAGGTRALYMCSQPGCVGSFAGSKAALVRAGAEVKVATPGPYGHSLNPPLRASINAALPWLVDGLLGWEAYGAAPKLPFH